MLPPHYQGVCKVSPEVDVLRLGQMLLAPQENVSRFAIPDLLMIACLLPEKRNDR